ncbi:MAG: hypothetical protein ACK4IT_06025 [Thioalkalivibrionaceae bacterium]
MQSVLLGASKAWSSGRTYRLEYGAETVDLAVLRPPLRFSLDTCEHERQVVPPRELAYSGSRDRPIGGVVNGVD